MPERLVVQEVRSVLADPGTAFLALFNDFLLITVSIRTVESQLSVVFRKLGVRVAGPVGGRLAECGHQVKTRASTDAGPALGRLASSTVTTGSRRFFLVERYVSAREASSIVDTIRELARSRDDARHVGTVVLPGEETCLSVFEAKDAPAVAAVNEGLPLDRIVEAEWFPGPSS